MARQVEAVPEYYIGLVLFLYQVTRQNTSTSGLLVFYFHCASELIWCTNIEEATPQRGVISTRAYTRCAVLPTSNSNPWVSCPFYLVHFQVVGSYETSCVTQDLDSMDSDSVRPQ